MSGTSGNDNTFKLPTDIWGGFSFGLNPLGNYNQEVGNEMKQGNIGTAMQIFNSDNPFGRSTYFQQRQGGANQSEALTQANTSSGLGALATIASIFTGGSSLGASGGSGAAGGGATAGSSSLLGTSSGSLLGEAGAGSYGTSLLGSNAGGSTALAGGTGGMAAAGYGGSAFDWQGVIKQANNMNKGQQQAQQTYKPATYDDSMRQYFDQLSNMNRSFYQKGY